MLTDLYNISGSPYLKTYPITTENFRPHYGKGEARAPDTLHVREGDLVDLMQELPHSYAYNQPEYGEEVEKYHFKHIPSSYSKIVEGSSDPSYDVEYRKKREGAARKEFGEIVEPPSLLSWLIDPYVIEDKSRYTTPGTVEYEAHKLLEPLFWDYMKSSLGY